MRKTVLLYGICGGLLIAALKLVEYRFLVVEHSLEIYGGIVALVFATIGVWVGQTITRKRGVRVVQEAPVAPPGFVQNEPKVAELGITPRELEILQRIASGMSTREIAAALFVGENTVKTHASRLFGKLNVNRRTQAVDVGKRLGIIP